MTSAASRDVMLAGTGIDASPRTHEGTQKLLILEVGRAIAALFVVLHHADQATAHFSDVARERLFMWGQYGVDFFFVLSGFIIYHSHKNDRPGIGPAKNYLFKRLTRIFVPYLPVALAWMGLLVLFQEGAIAERSWGFWATITLLPLEKSSTLTVAWTLTYELMFYAFFLLAYVSMWIFAVASLVWGIILLLVLVGILEQGDGPVIYALSNPIVLEFFCGVLAAYAFIRIDPKLRGWILAAGCLALLAVAITWTGQRALLGPSLALIVLASAMFQPKVGSASLGVAVFLGAASYAIYLVHSQVVSVTAEVMQPLDARGVVFSVSVALGVAMGVMYHLLFEKTALRRVRRFAPNLA